MGVNVGGSNRRKRKMQEAPKRKMRGGREGILQVCDTGPPPDMRQLAQFSLRCTSESFLRCNPCPSTKSAFQPPDVRHRHRQCQFGGGLGSWRWRQGSPFLPAAGWCGCRHQWQRQGQGKAGDDDGQCSVAASSDIGHCLLHQGSRLLLVDLTSPMESGALAFRQGRALSAHYRRC